MGDVLRGIGKIAGVAAPLAGLIPGVGPLAAAGIGAGGKLLGNLAEKKPALGGVVEGGAEGGLGGLAQKLGALNSGGKFDPMKAVGAAGSVMDLIGQGKQRKSAQDYSNAEIAQRNALMSKILGPKDFNMSPSPNLNQQSSATPGIGAGY